MTRGNFEYEEPDIVRLEPATSESPERSGWVNVGAHALRILVDQAGNLTVEAYAQGNECKTLASLAVSKRIAMNAGATDLDA